MRDQSACRIEALQEELDQWLRDTERVPHMNAHFTQVRAIEVLLRAFASAQRSALETLDPDGDVSAFKAAAWNLQVIGLRAQKTWDFFREKLHLRHSPEQREPLWVADTVAWDCYRTVLDIAVELDILERERKREPPLVYCTSEYSAATWVRGSRPNDGRVYALGTSLLPIPVIELPWDHLNNSWEYLSIHHEVGHDIEADLGLRSTVDSALEGVLSKAGIPGDRISIWLGWTCEVFADFCALQLAGPTFAAALMNLLVLPDNLVRTFDAADPHPTPYLRVLLATAYTRTLTDSTPVRDHAALIERTWKELYGADSGSYLVDSLIQDFPHVIRGVMDTPLDRLRGNTARRLIPFFQADDLKIRAAADFFRSGIKRPHDLPPRHAISAARLAVEQQPAAGDGPPCKFRSQVQSRVVEFIKENVPPGLRAGDSTAAHEAFIASFADKIFSS